MNLKMGSTYFIYFVLRSKYFIDFVESQMKGMAYPAISDSNFQKGIIPVPPIEEQKVIVAKVKQLMSWCDELEKKIEKRDAYQEKMIQAVVKQAFKTEKETVETE